MRNILTYISILLFISCNTNNQSKEQHKDNTIEKNQNNEDLFDIYMEDNFDLAETLALKYKIDNSVAREIVIEYTKTIEPEIYNFIKNNKYANEDETTKIKLVDFIKETSDKTGIEKSTVASFFVDYIKLKEINYKTY